MLVLSRKLNERIRIGEGIVIVVKRLGEGKVSLGIQAPPDCLILRDELEAFLPEATATIPMEPKAPEAASTAEENANTADRQAG